jgi:dihydroneopterin aldolase
MDSSITIHGIQLNAQCGVTETERRHPQPILLDLTLRCPNDQAFHSDQLTDTVDYAALTQRVREIGERQPCALLETLAEHLCQKLFQEFSLTQIDVWVRKTRPPMKDFTGTVGIRLLRSRQDMAATEQSNPSPFLVSQLSRLPRGKVLDVATGRGRHAHFLATQGFSVHGIDRNRETLEFLDAQAREAGRLPITTEYIDLETDDLNPPDLGTETYDAILVFFYLYRPLFPQLMKALKSGGVILYETFLLDNHLQRQHPRRKEFCLETNELLTLLSGLQIIHYDEGDHTGASVTDRAFTAQALARKI